MADNMIKFYKGLVDNLPSTGVNGALYVTTDEGGIYLGTGTGMKRLGDFVQVANVAALPAKAHENCLYYCVSENILAKWNGAEWKQINKQPTAEELKVLLGLGSVAYLSEISEANLSAELAEKVNASAEGNHAHANKDVLDGITAEKVAAWDAAEANAEGYADDLNTAMNTRVEALEAVDHEHANKALLDTYTQTEENLADAVAKKHEHANKTELDKIAAGDKAKWDAVAADYLTSTDKAAIEDSIGDVNTALTEEVNRAKAAEGANTTAIGTLRADMDEGLAAKVDKVEGKSLIADSEITRLGGMSDGANKVEESATNGNIKIDGVETVVYTHPDKHTIAEVDGLQAALDGKQAVGDYATREEAQGYADAKDEAIAAAQKTADDTSAALAEHIETAEGTYETKTDASNKLTEAKGYTDTEVGKVQTAVDELEDYVGTIPSDDKYADITNVIAYVNKKAEETLASAQGGSSETAASVKAALETYKAENDPKVQANTEAIAAIEADYLTSADIYDDTQVKADIKANADAIDAIEADYLKGADKTELQEQITTNANAIERLTNGVSAEEVDGVNDLIAYVNEHGAEVTGIKADIAANAKAISDHETLASETYETKGDAEDKLEEAKGYADDTKAAVIGASTDASSADTVYGAKKYAEEKAAEAQGAAEATASGALAEAKAELEGKITDGDAATLAAAKEDASTKVNALAEGQVKTNTEAIATKANAADVYTKTEVDTLLTWGSF